ncbi:MAG: quinone-dependent dihydroorotate dehydrogenase [Planctomycetes bacterium]|nr:quinone-dependent dihydroorotate dehydrogenase [Planctomycetota bacterium]
MYRSLVYPILARIEPERAHGLALKSLRAAQATPGGLVLLRCFAGPRDPRLEVKAFGQTFANPVGAAAGMDKNADAVGALLALGFGHVEVGTVTPRPQPGNNRPRVWRLPEAAALLNALGFPSKGAAAVAKRLDGKRFKGIVGINLGKNKDTPPEKAAEDYVAVFEKLRDGAKYAVVNVSSPNTPGLRALQSRSALAGIVKALAAVNTPKLPILVKLSPDLDEAQLDEALAGSMDGGASGFIVSNTTLDRSSLAEKFPERPGGLSGAPLKARALKLVGDVRRRLGAAVPIIGVGGIATAGDVIDRMKAGATLVQVYTGFVYGGPGLIGQIARGLLEFVEREKLASIADIVGSATP